MTTKRDVLIGVYTDAEQEKIRIIDLMAGEKDAQTKQILNAALHCVTQVVCGMGMVIANSGPDIDEPVEGAKPGEGVSRLHALEQLVNTEDPIDPRARSGIPLLFSELEEGDVFMLHDGEHTMESPRSAIDPDIVFRKKGTIFVIVHSDHHPHSVGNVMKIDEVDGTTPVVRLFPQFYPDSPVTSKTVDGKRVVANINEEE